MEFRKMRRFAQQIADEECIRVLKTSKRGVLAMNGENGYPFAIYVNPYYDESDGKIYFHGAKEGQKIELLKKNNKVCFTIIDEGFVREGEWAKRFNSVVCFGHIDTVTDHDKVMEQCRRLASKFPIPAEELEDEIRRAGERVNVLCMTIDYMSGKRIKEA